MPRKGARYLGARAFSLGSDHVAQAAEFSVLHSQSRPCSTVALAKGTSTDENCSLEIR